MNMKTTPLFLITLIACITLIGCDDAQRMMPDRMPAETDTHATPVKLVSFVNYPAGNREAALEWISEHAPALQAPAEVLRIRAYANTDPKMSPDGLIEFDFNSFLDAATYLNRPEIAAILEDLPNRTDDVKTHTFIQRSSYSKGEDVDLRIKGVLLIDYPLGGKAAYLEWVASISAALVTPSELKATASYDNYYGESPHRLVELEFATQADGDAYEALEGIMAIEAELDTQAGSWESLTFELQASYTHGSPRVFVDETPMPAPMDAEIPIGVAVALTGPFAEPYGLPMQRGLELARQEINMHSDTQLTFVTVDAQSTVAGGVAAVEQLVDQGVPAIVGIGLSTHLTEAFPIAQDNGVVALSPISSATGLSALGDYIFRGALTIGVLNSNGTRVTHEKLGYRKVALIYDAADTYSISSNAAFQKTLATLGVEVLTVETHQTGDTDFSTQLTAIMNMAPDAVFISALSAEMPQIITQARAIGIPDTVPLIVPDLTAKEIQEAGRCRRGCDRSYGVDGFIGHP